MRPLSVLIVASLALLAMSCTAGDPPDGAHAAVGLVETSWQLFELAGAPLTHEEPRRAPTLQLEEKSSRVVASSGCNRINGSYTREGRSLSFGRLMMTRMACPGLAEQEQRYLTALESTSSYEISGRDLTLLDGDHAVARFTAAQPR